MTCAQLAKLLLEQPNADTLHVVAQVGNDWADIWGLCPTGQHRNAITLDLTMPNGGLLVVEPDIEEQP